jgi:hypothetical protein
VPEPSQGYRALPVAILPFAAGKSGQVHAYLLISLPGKAAMTEVMEQTF